MQDKKLNTICGTNCGDCDFFGKNCEGCYKVHGKPFWTAEFNITICPLFDCCKNQRKLEHCGVCNDFPCKTFMELRDPSMSDAEFKKSLDMRIDNLKSRL